MTSSEGAGCQCDPQHRDQGRDTSSAWQELPVPAPALTQAAAGQGQELTVSVECPWDILEGPSAGIHIPQLPATSLGALLPFPEQQSRVRAVLFPSQ